jgi:hypothetical protein
MKTIVYGVTNWDDEEEFKIECPLCNKKNNLIEWYNRIVSFIPNIEHFFLTTGTYSDPSLNPLPIPVYQIPFFKVFPYSAQNNYFRVGFMTGIWKSLLEAPDFDLLIHIQTTRMIGTDLTPLIEEFMSREEQLMAMRFTSGVNREDDIKGIDVGFMAMKREAALMYAVGGRRFSCDNNPEPMNCEDEAYLMFNESWMTLWPDIPTPKQHDLTYKSGFSKEELSEYRGRESWYEITDVDYFKSLPIIATGKHVDHDFYQAWLNANPYEKK